MLTREDKQILAIAAVAAVFFGYNIEWFMVIQ